MFNRHPGDIISMAFTSRSNNFSMFDIWPAAECPLWGGKADMAIAVRDVRF
jgi:hypothetical protein